VQSLESQFTELPGINTVTVPDLWQQQAVAALREGKDVVVQAPTGSGKTLIFELWSNSGKPRGQAIYTVPTRALANDKLAEWRARGWDVGIATGDLAENLSASPRLRRRRTASSPATARRCSSWTSIRC
jgi:superfamily II RNA helicase